jgi:uncharacterized protein
MQLPSAYLEGVRLFNEGHYWHAHEAWEEVWKVEVDPSVLLFYKGIIQTAAALVHWQRGNPRGLDLNWAKARAKLVVLPPLMLGLDLRQLVDEMDRFAASAGAEHTPPQLVPRAAPRR